MNPINIPPFNNRSFCNCLLLLNTFFPKDILGNGQWERLQSTIILWDVVKAVFGT